MLRKHTKLHDASKGLSEPSSHGSTIAYMEHMEYFFEGVIKTARAVRCRGASDDGPLIISRPSAVQRSWSLRTSLRRELSGLEIDVMTHLYLYN